MRQDALAQMRGIPAAGVSVSLTLQIFCEGLDLPVGPTLYAAVAHSGCAAWRLAPVVTLPDGKT